MAKLQASGAKFTNGTMFSCCNILMCVAIVFIILHILGYTNASVHCKEGMSGSKMTPLVWIIVAFIIFIGIVALFGMFKSASNR